MQRFNYWNIPAINPWAGSVNGLPGPYEFDPNRPDEIAHEALNADYASRVDAGDEDAVFQFVAIDAHAFRSPWVIDLIEQWRQAGRGEDLRRLMAAYATNQGKTNLAALIPVIRKDLQVFQLLLDKMGLDTVSEGDERLIRRQYRPLYNSVVPVRFSRAEFFQEMEAIVSRLEAAIG